MPPRAPQSNRSQSELTEAIRSRALALGFDLVGFTPAGPMDGGARLDAWLGAGHDADMAWIARSAEKRKDPERVVSGARSFISVAMNYRIPDNDASTETDASDETSRAPRGRTARYAWGDDYHDVMLAALKRLRDEVAELSGAAAYVDTGPILEREVAAAAGLGWIGKNTNLIRRGVGSWILLGEIVATVELDYDAPVRNLCGSCTRCIDECPTQAIVAPYVVDSRRCISYLTIEQKGEIPEVLRPGIGDWVFGCDVCQDVCPWNRKIDPASVDHFSARGEAVRSPDLIELIGIDDETFRERFRGSAMKRTKRRGLRRNAAIALGNVGAADALPVLRAVLDDPDPIVAEAAEWAVTQITRREESKNP